MTNEPLKPKHLVCAIYTRKSTSEGLNQEFTSLDNQRESAENYIKSQQHEGWSVSNESYDDGGFTGANIERPALQKLLAHIREGRINCVIVYKVDRLSRSLLDFTQLLEFFDKHNVSFVSITQQFNTNTSMGRLTLNILLSFAQFEREIISERVRDKMGAARKRGQWTGGFIPFGYRKHPELPRKIEVDPEEALIVRKIFSLYLDKADSALGVKQLINDEGYRTRSWTTRAGKPLGQLKFSINRILYILKNYTYAGKVNYGGQIYPSQEPAVIDEETFNKVQQKILHNRLTRKPYRHKGSSGLLYPLLKCSSCGDALTHTYSIKKGRPKYRYYYCANARNPDYPNCSTRYRNAVDMEARIMQILRTQIQDLKDSTYSLEIDSVLSPEWDSLPLEEQRRVLQIVIEKADHNTTTQTIGMILSGSSNRVEFPSNFNKLCHKSKASKKLMLGKEPPIRKTLLVAHQLSKHLSEGRIKDIVQASLWTGISQSRLNHILGLLHLSPSIQEQIMTDNSPLLDSIPEYKVRDLSSEPDWAKQSSIWQELVSSLTVKNSIAAILKSKDPLPSKWLLQS